MTSFEDLRDRVGAVYEDLGVRRVAVAVSGGLDSCALARLTWAAGTDMVLIHVDHGLRPESADDARFVRTVLAGLLEVPCRVVSATPGAGNVQAEARATRYAALEAAAVELGCDAVATAHTADDQAETLLLALVRGAGLRGLAGMPPERPISPGGSVRLVRPLLGIERADLEALTTQQEWSWREEASNATDAYRRNRIRHHVMPLLREEGGPGTARRIAAAADAARDALHDVGPARRLADLGVVDARGGALRTVDLAPLAPAARRALWAEALAAWTDGPRSADLVARVDALLGADPGRRVDAGRWVAWRDRHTVRVVRSEPEPEALALHEPPPWSLDHAYGTLTATPAGSDETAYTLSRDPLSEVVDRSALLGVVELRRWRPGDRIWPAGALRDRLVSDLLDARRVPPSERARRLVLIHRGEILWLVAERLGAGRPLGEATGDRVRLTWTPREAAHEIDRPGEAPRP